MNIRSTLATTAVLAAAGLAAVACTSPADPAATLTPGDTVVSTAGQTPEATAAAARAAAAARPDNWVAAPASALSVPAGVLAPGAWMSIPERGKFCTLNAGVRSAGGGRDGFLTAGHCGDDGMAVRLDGDTGAFLGVISDSDESFDSARDVLSDSAVVWTTDPAPYAAKVGGLPVAGVMTRDAARELKKGTPVCFDGATSGLVCSPLDGADLTTLMIEGAAKPGDSGAPVFLVDGDTGAATLLGIAKMVKNMTTITYLDPALDRLNAAALVDPTAAAAVAGDPRYSTHVTPLN